MSIPNSINHAISFPCGSTMDLDLPAVLDDEGEVVDLSSGYTASLKVRNDDFDGTLALELTESAGLTLAALGIITVTATAVQTLAMRDDMPQKGVYTLEVTLTAGTVVSRTHCGVATLSDTTIHA